MDFAPYQDTDPERERALSPPPPGNRALSPSSRSAAKSPPPPNGAAAASHGQFTSSSLPAPSHFSDSYQDGGTREGFGGGGEGRAGGDLEGGRFGVDVNLFETSLPLRLDYEAMLAYLLLPPAGGVFLLVIEHKSDYVRYVARISRSNGMESLADPTQYSRFHAWQSSLLFSAIFVLHLIFSWSQILSWMLFAVDLCIMAFLAFRAYTDGKAFSIHYKSFRPEN